MRAAFLDTLGGQRIYPITDRQLSGLSHAEQVAQLARLGFRLVQLREKYLSPLEFHDEAEAAMKVARANNVCVLINDRVDIALAVSAHGVHLGQDDLSVEGARSLLGENAIIGFSTHSLEQAQQAGDLPIDYLALGPIFPTKTKEKADPVVGVEALVQVKESLPGLPLVAIGGIDATNRELVFSAGADAVAVISDLWSGLSKPQES